ncbi:MAG TPA: response regulator transcription factor [Verrucomicrobiae bacterium]|nr:response regulator transcription factor [Verrucomicrobiae bacterium]
MNINVAVVEDDDDVRESLSKLIEGTEGFSCTGAYRSAEIAIKGILEAPPNVVVMDINLPRASGIECVQQLRTHCPNVNVLMLTIYDDGDNIFRALEAGANGYLLKRTPPGEILKAIEEVNAGGAPMTSSIARRVLQSFHQRATTVPADEKLTMRETEILDLLSKGYLYKEIAGLLNLHFDTVHSHVRNIYNKLHVRSRTEAVTKYLRPAE